MIEATTQLPPPATSAGESRPRSPSPDVRYAFLLGKGRTGTTWIGQILNRFPRCIYKYEPFSPDKNPHFGQWVDDLEAGDAEDLARRFRDLTSRCFHDVDFPPFYRKTCRRQTRLSLRATWQLGRIYPPARALYEWYGRPRFRDGDWVFTKQVNFPNPLLPKLAEVLSPKIVAIVRNPFASVDASLRFNKGYRVATPEQSRSVVRQLRELGIEVPLRPNEVDSLSDATYEAIVWRLQIEPLETFIRSYKDGMILKYEAFASCPKESARDVFQFLGWPYDESVDRFIDRTSQGASALPDFRHRSEFSIYRDSRAMIERWKKELTAEQIADVRRIVEGCRLLELWPELNV